MKKLFLLSLIGLAFGSCATIFTKSSYPVTFTSTPSGVGITVANRAGNTVYTGSTPATVKLKSAAGYMKREEYSVTFSHLGHASQTVSVLCNLDGWYIGNILLGGVIGMLIVDPASGAMYKFAETNVHANMRQEAPTTANMELQIIDINQIPKDVKLTRIN